MAKCAFIGLGVMGYPMAGFLQQNGHDVRVWNRTGEKATGWAKQYGGVAWDTIVGAVADCDFVFACVGDDPDVRAIAGPAFEAMKAGAVFVDHTTASAALARELAIEADIRKLGFIDAPVSGGQAGAEAGQLSIMCGGEREDFAKAEPIMNCYAKAITLMGEAGAGQLTKMVNQICIAGVVEGLAEGLHFAKRAGLNGEKVIEAISKGAAQSWQMENRYKTMLRGQFDFGFAVDWMRKDLRITLEEARTNGARLPVAALVDQFYADVQAMGGKRWDTSSLIARLEKY
ncbi:MAG: oxidoreductase [Robiginitomaculum sp.]|nr:MAG: oxidoreductase [Robiginitomaculum sp.]